MCIINRWPIFLGICGLSIGHVSPEAAEGGNIGLLQEGDRILIDIPKRKIEMLVSDDEIQIDG